MELWNRPSRNRLRQSFFHIWYDKLLIGNAMWSTMECTIEYTTDQYIQQRNKAWDTPTGVSGSGLNGVFLVGYSPECPIGRSMVITYGKAAWRPMVHTMVAFLRRQIPRNASWKITTCPILHDTGSGHLPRIYHGTSNKGVTAALGQPLHAPWHMQQGKPWFTQWYAYV